MNQRLVVHPGEKVMVHPLDTSLTPNQARELQEHLRRCEPDIQWLVLPLAADITVLSVEEDEVATQPEQMTLHFESGQPYMVCPEHGKFFAFSPGITSVELSVMQKVAQGHMDLVAHPMSAEDYQAALEAALEREYGPEWRKRVILLPPARFNTKDAL